MLDSARLVAIGLLLGLALAGCSNTAEDWFKKGQASLARGDAATAIVHFKAAAQTSPNDAAIRFHLGVAYNGLFDGASAEKELSKALELGLVEEGRVMAALARALWLQGTHQAILDRADASPGFSVASSSEIAAYRGHAFAALGKLDQARKSLARARVGSTPPAGPLVELLEANIRLSGGDSKAALAIVERVLGAHPGWYDALALRADLVRVTGSPETAIAAYSELLKIHPSNLIALVGRSTLLTQLERFDEAEQDVKSLQIAYKDHFIAHFQDGLLRYRKGQFQMALAAFNRVLKLNRDHEPALLFEGMTQLALGSAQSAQRSLAQYVTARPNDLMGRRMLASALVRLNEGARALEVIAPALERGESHPGFFQIAGEAYARMGDMDKAMHWLDKAEQAAPDDPALQQMQATLNMRRGRLDLAMGDYAQAARLSKRLTNADSMLVLLNLRLRDYERAHAAVNRMEEKAPTDPFVANMRGAVLLAQGKTEQAVESFENVLKMHPAFLPAAANLAKIDMQGGKVEQAKRRFEGVLADDKTHLQALLVVAQFEHRLGKTKESIALLERAAAAHPTALAPRSRLVELLMQQGNFQLARSRAEEAVTRNPTSAAALELLASVKMREGDKHSAVATFARIVELHPKSPAAHVARAQAERAAGMPKEAEASLRRALELQRSYAPAQATLFELLVQQNRLPQALEFAKQLKAELPRSPIGHVFEAEVALVQKKFKDAVAPYQTALKIARTGDLAARVFQVRVFAGEREAALADLKRWVEEHPRQAHARAQLADVLLADGDYTGAAKEYQNVVQTAPASARLVNHLAWALHKTGDQRRALQFAESAKKLAPDDPYIDDTLGWLLLEGGKIKEARELLARAAGKLKDRPDVRYHYAAALAKSGDKERARAELSVALSTQQAFPEREEAAALMATLR